MNYIKMTEVQITSLQKAHPKLYVSSLMTLASGTKTRDVYSPDRRCKFGLRYLYTILVTG